MFDIIKKILIWQKEFVDTNYQRVKKTLVYIKNSLIDSDGNMYLIVDTLIRINNIIISSNNITLRKVNINHMDLIKCIWTKI